MMIILQLIIAIIIFILAIIILWRYGLPYHIKKNIHLNAFKKN